MVCDVFLLNCEGYYKMSEKKEEKKTKSKTVKNLKAKKKYYVQIRAYKTISGKTYYSAWSAVKAVKTR